jgi:hypothetical protein
MEQVVMVLVFALAAALCLRVFAFSDRMSERNSDIDHAVLLAQNTAELLKACGGVEEAAAVAGGTIRQMMWSTYYDAQLNPVEDQADAYYVVDTLPINSGVEGLGKAAIEVFRHDGNTGLFFITAAWQEVSGNG